MVKSIPVHCDTLGYDTIQSCAVSNELAASIFRAEVQILATLNVWNFISSFLKPNNKPKERDRRHV
jgi:hypothetical protein